MKQLIHHSKANGPFTLDLCVFGEEDLWEVLRSYHRSSTRVPTPHRWWFTTHVLHYTESRAEFIARCIEDARAFAATCGPPVRLQSVNRDLRGRSTGVDIHWRSDPPPSRPNKPTPPKIEIRRNDQVTKGSNNGEEQGQERHILKAGAGKE